MALKKSEKQLVGVMLFVVAGVAMFMFGMPSFGKIQENWAKKTELETSLKTMAGTESTLQLEITTLKQQMQLPNDIKLRKHTPENLQAMVKQILDKVLDMAVLNSNTIISLAPWKDVPPILPPAPPASPNAPAATPATGAAPADPNAPPAPPPPPPLTVIGYDLALRGTFATVQAFIKEMDKQKELVEMSNIEIVNEQGPDRGASTTSSSGDDKNSDGPILDPTKPVKLITKLRLVLEPEGGINVSSTPAPVTPSTP